MKKFYFSKIKAALSLSLSIMGFALLADHSNKSSLKIFTTSHKWHIKSLVDSHYVKRSAVKSEQLCSVVEPVDGAKDVAPALVKISVSLVEGARHYTVELNTSPDFSGTSIVKESLSDYQRVFIFKDLLPETTYYARAKSNFSKYGAGTNFKTRPAKSSKRLWGVSTMGGAHNQGTVFSFSADSLMFRNHHHYENYTGATLNGNLTPAASGKLYGVSTFSGTGFGEIYSIDNTGKFEYVTGSGPHLGGLTIASDNFLYIVDDWINIFRGGVYRINEEGDEVPPLERVIHKFQNLAEGRNPMAPLTEAPDGFLYGTTPYGGSNNHGVIYKLKPDGSEFSVIHSFDGVTGAHPNSTLTVANDGYLYGMSPFGGKFNQGVLFKMLPDGTFYKKLYDFNDKEGKHPMGNIIEFKDGLYGMTSEGGNTNEGIIFRINHDGSGFTKVFDFTHSKGAHPLGGLTVDGNILWGMTSQGGDNDMGVIFKWQEDKQGIEVVHHFTAASGGSPNGSLLLQEDMYEMEPKSQNTNLFTVHPNPFESEFVAQINSELTEDAKLTLIGMNGSVIREFTMMTNTPLYLGDDLEKGIYVLKIISGSGVSVHRIIKR